jgi:hypothetical protein
LSNGLHTFKVELTKSIYAANLRVFNVRLSGNGVNESYVVKERWRPKARYSRWMSSANPDDVRAWIIELSSDSEYNHYSPITTNFGCTGPIFKLGGIARNMNMSIWSSS